MSRTYGAFLATDLQSVLAPYEVNYPNNHLAHIQIVDLNNLLLPYHQKKSQEEKQKCLLGLIQNNQDTYNILPDSCPWKDLLENYK